MVYRLSGLGAALGIALALARLGRLLRVTDGGPPWQIILIAGAVLGAFITWSARSYGWKWPWVISMNLAGVILALIRVGAPSTTIAGILPSPQTLETLQTELGFALELLRFGSAPVVPVAGLVASLTVVFWVLGALAGWALADSKPWLGTLPPLLLYLQLATIDRYPSSISWTVAFLATIALGVAFAAHEERITGTGRLRGRSSKPLARSALLQSSTFIAALMVAAILGTTLVAGSVPGTGVLNWRARTGLGDGIYGGVSYNLFVGSVQSDLLSLSDEPVFIARVSETSVPSQQLYWRLATLDRFDGTNWYLSAQKTWRPEPGDAWQNSDHVFRGPTVMVDQIIQIRTLRQNFLPSLYVPGALEAESDIVSESYRVREDGSIKFDARTFDGLTYRLRSEVPAPNLNALATTDGQLSPIFETAAQRDAFSGSAQSPGSFQLPNDIADFTELPTDINPTIGELARAITEEASTPFERALFLEGFLRDTRPGGFTYSVDIDAGHSASILVDWLLDPESPNYRTGYCEQFATAMAVMARSVGIPSRVVIGFTPGEATEDGTIVVRQRNAHSWVELWMLGQGWMAFDPTPRSDGVNPSTTETLVGFNPALFIPEPDDFGTDPGNPNGAAGDDIPGRQFTLEDLLGGRPDIDPITLATGEASRQSTVSWQTVALLSLLTGITAIPLFKLARRWTRLRRLHRGDVAAGWTEIVDRLIDLRSEVGASLTPLEVASTVDASLIPLAVTYGKSIYGPTDHLNEAELQRGVDAFKSTESTLKFSHPRRDLLLARFRIRSLKPGR